MTASAPSSPKAGRRLTWEELQRYWQIHAARWSNLDWDVDPEGLANVCQPGQPHWLNEYYARSQRLVFERLLALVPPPGPGSRALDIGCGAGRWTRLLAACGYITTGIDIQSRLIELNRERFPGIEFEDEALQEFAPARQFDLITSVTVLQHFPFEEQLTAVRKVRSLIKPGGFALLLENIAYQAPHVFSRSVDGWVDAFDREGFGLVATRRYNYSFALKACAYVRRLMGGDERSRMGHEATVEELVPTPKTTPERGTRAVLGKIHRLVLRVAIAFDAGAETLLLGTNLAQGATHCGFLFRAGPVAGSAWHQP